MKFFPLGLRNTKSLCPQSPLTCRTSDTGLKNTATALTQDMLVKVSEELEKCAPDEK